MTEADRLLRKLPEASPNTVVLAQRLGEINDELDQLHSQLRTISQQFPDELEEIAAVVDNGIGLIGKLWEQLEQGRARLVAYMALGDVEVSD